MTWPRSVLRVIVPLFLLCAVAQFFFAGLTVFGNGSGALWHMTLGDAMVAFALVIMLVAVFAGRRLAILGVVLVLLMVLQYALARFGAGLSPWVGALHAVNALAIMGVAGGGIQRVLAEERAEAPPAPAGLTTRPAP